MRKGTIYILILLMVGYFSWNIQVHYCADTIASVEIAANEASGCSKCVKKSSCCETVSIQNHTSQFLTTKQTLQVKKQVAEIVRLKHFVVEAFNYKKQLINSDWTAYNEVLTNTPIFLRNQQFRL